MAQEVNLELGLAPPDPWVLKKNLSDSDLRGSLILPKQGFKVSILPEMDEATITGMRSLDGIEVKIHIVEEGHEADDYIVTLKFYENKYMFVRGWSSIARVKSYKTGDKVGLFWEKSSGKFLFHHINCDSWVLEKNLTDSDLQRGGVLVLPKQRFEGSIIPEMDQATIKNMGSRNGVEVKIQIVEEGPEASDYTVTLKFDQNKYKFTRGWSSISKAKGYKT